jgi:hypothetical protein
MSWCTVAVFGQLITGSVRVLERLYQYCYFCEGGNEDDYKEIPYVDP